MRRVILESPFRGRTPEETDLNVMYARACLRDALLRGESPIASHLLFTQKGVLDDGNAEERAAGIEAGLAWGAVADATVVYVDRGLSPGMKLGVERAAREGRVVDPPRSLGEDWLQRHEDVVDAAIARRRLAELAGKPCGLGMGGKAHGCDRAQPWCASCPQWPARAEGGSAQTLNVNGAA